MFYDILRQFDFIKILGFITRDLLIYTKTNETLFNALTKGLENAQANLELVKSPVTTCDVMSPAGHVIFYKQGNSAASRKVILPLVKEIILGL